jgi:hypothetical protein
LVRRGFIFSPRIGPWALQVYDSIRGDLPAGRQGHRGVVVNLFPKRGDNDGLLNVVMIFNNIKFMLS